LDGGDFNLRDPLGSFVRTARGVLFSPRRFFAGIAERGDYVGPLIFALVCALIGGSLAGIVTFLLLLLEGDVLGAIVGLVATVILVLVRAALSLVVGAGVWHLLVLILIGSRNGGFEATFRVAAYASAIQLITWVAVIPVLGTVIALLAGLYGLYVASFGIEGLHSTTRQRAAAVVALPLLALILLGLIAGVLIPVLLSAR
jgi:hypothetical protein